MLSVSDPQSRSFARLAGLLYLTIDVSGGYAIAYVPSVLHAPGDPIATWNTILANRGVFLSGIAGDVVMMGAEVLITPMLYLMFRTVNPAVSLAAGLARIMMVAVMAAMLFFHVGGLLAAEGLAGFTEEQSKILAGLMLSMHDAGVWIWQIFFTLHLLMLGWLVMASGLYPRLLGLGLMVGGAGYLLDSIYAFALPDFAVLGWTRAGLLGVVTLSEVGFALWLLLVGPRPAKVAAQPA